MLLCKMGDHSMLYHLKLIILIYFLFYNVLYAGTMDPSNNNQLYIDYGNKFNCVVQICGTYHDDTLFCASGVTIKPRWILTAAHVVQKARVCKAKNNKSVTIVKKIIVHKKFQEHIFGNNDIALLYCEKSLDEVFYPNLYNERNELGSQCSIAGYGISGNFDTGAKISDDKKRAGTNIISYIDKDLLVCVLNDKKTFLEFLIAHGDSGGGLFINDELAGINSCVMTTDKNPDSSYGDESGHTRISNFIEWINTNIKENDYEEK